MPDFDLFLVDWKKAAAYHKKEALETMLADAIPRSAKWIKQLPWVGKAPADYFDVADAWEAMKEEPEGVPEKMHAAACAFMDVTITYQDFHNDLGAENVLLAISPKAAARFSTLARKVDFSLYQKAFETNCPQEFQEQVGRYLPAGRRGKPFKNAFLPFIEMCVKIVDDAAREKKGLLAVVQ